MTAPDTVTEAVAFLASEGYVDDYRLCPEGIVSSDHDSPHPVETVVVDHTFRFEGPSDPADEAIVLGIRCTEWNRKGVIVAAYGPDMEIEEAEMLTSLTRGRHGVTPPQQP